MFLPTFDGIKSVLQFQFSLTFLQNANFPWPRIKFPDISLTLKNFFPPDHFPTCGNHGTASQGSFKLTDGCRQALNVQWNYMREQPPANKVNSNNKVIFNSHYMCMYLYCHNFFCLADITLYLFLLKPPLLTYKIWQQPGSWQHITRP